LINLGLDFQDWTQKFRRKFETARHADSLYFLKIFSIVFPFANSSTNLSI
jgi:hypothetical protein